MSKKHIKSKPGLFGMVYYYDENDNPIGKSRPGLLEGTRVYTDQNGEYAGKSRPGFLAKEIFTDANRDYISSYDSFGGEIYFKNGTPIGYSRPGFFGSSYTSLEVDDDIQGQYVGKYKSFNQYIYEDCERYISQLANRILKVIGYISLFILICTVIVCVYLITKSS